MRLYRVIVVPAALVLGLVLAPGAAERARAQPLSPQDLPPELRPWVPWVLDEVRDYGCPRVQGRPVCLWPGRLRLDLGSTGGTLALEVHADREADLRLPGSAEVWPEGLTLDGRPAAVHDRGGSPGLRVPAGRHRVSGRFVWSRLPESLGVPPEIGLVELSVEGRRVARPRRERSGLLWVRARTDEAAGERESLRLQVFRRVADGIPVFVETRLQLEVSGRAREVALPLALLPGTVAVDVGGDLPARVEEGTLRVQVRGGRFGLRVLARVEGRPEALERPPADSSPGDAAKDPSSVAPGAPAWPEREVWVFQANEELRQAELSGPAAIDPSRTELPDEWRALPAFLVEPGGRLALATTRRGQPHAAPDALELVRAVWVDPDGSAMTVRDRFAGTLHGTTRLDLLPPGTLGRVAVDGDDQLVTANPQTQAPGVELRRATLRLEADSRLPRKGALHAVGWTTAVERLQTTLHLSPGWSILGATGVDQLPGTWTSRWTLLGFFFVLLVAFAAHRLFGPRHAALAAVTLVLTHGEPGAPFLVWLSLLAALALRRVAPAGRLGSVGRIWFLASAGVLVLALVPFARDQVRDALFPQVAGGPAPGRGGVEGGVAGGVVGGVVGGVPAPVVRDQAAPMEAQEESTDELRSLGYVGDEAAAKSEYERKADRPRAPASQEPSRAKARESYAYNVALEQDPKAVLQTGPGVPSWAWRTYSLAWTGPVGRDHRMRLFLASPALNRALTAVRLVLVALLAWVVFTGRWPRRPRGRAPEGGAAVAGVTTLLLIALAGARVAEPADTPSPQLLEELRKRLTRPAPCEPGCVTTPAMDLRVSDERLEVRAEVHAAADGTWAMPGPLASWAAADVRLDGTPAVAVAQLADGFLHLRLPPGVHRVELSGPLPPGDSFTLQMPSLPRRARADAPGWEVTGLRGDGPPDPSVQFTRRLSALRRGASVEGGRYAPWLEVTRTLRFGVSWTVETRVRRVTPPGAPVAVRVPLVAGEAPTRAQLAVEDGEVAVSLGADEVEAGWESTLEAKASLSLRAPEGRPWSEVWRLQCSTIWACTADGLPPVRRFAGGVFEPTYRPWPGESLEVSLAHPAGIEGQTLTADSLRLEATPGARLERVRLLVRIRSSREQPFLLHLPRGAEVQQVLLDGEERPSRPQESGELRVSVPAGAHGLEVRWQQERGMGPVYALPRLGVPGTAVNVTQSLTLPPSRWLLVTWGPAWGPAVLFWPYLVFLLAVAIGLGRHPASPLTSAQWILLGLGLSQIPAIGALVVAGFVLALAARRRRQPAGALAFDLMQVGLAAWALVSLVLLYAAIHQGLLLRPDMQVAGNGSTDTALNWYADRASGQTPSAGLVSLPLWVYRLSMLAWALWLATSLVRAVAWGWRAFGEGGLWRTLTLRRPPGPRTPDESGAKGGSPLAGGDDRRSESDARGGERP